MSNDQNDSDQAASSVDQDSEYTRKTLELTEELIEIINEYSSNREESIEESMRNLMSLLVALQEVGGFMFFYSDDVSYDPNMPNPNTRSMTVAVNRDTLDGLNDIAREHDLSLEDVLEIGIRNNKQVEEQKEESETNESETDDSGSGGDLDNDITLKKDSGRSRTFELTEAMVKTMKRFFPPSTPEKHFDDPRKTFELTEEAMEILSAFSSKWEVSMTEALRKLIGLFGLAPDVGGVWVSHLPEMSYDPETRHTVETRSITVAVNPDTLDGLNDIARQFDISLVDVIEAGIRTYKVVDEQEVEPDTGELRPGQKQDRGIGYPR